ncbi:MAG: penicillin-binding transpeptidase domain-containing protein [Eubacteriales bacterium]|nr:penicillin-binding transpeptidase domain-containing protein [Eubacteriales bacterium]
MKKFLNFSFKDRPLDADKQLNPQRIKRRFSLILALILLANTVLFLRTASLQFSGGRQPLVEETVGRRRQITVPAPRGDIIDLAGRPLAWSEEVESLYIVETGLSDKELNSQLLSLYELLESHGVKVESKFSEYFDFASDTVDSEQNPRFVFKQDMDVIRAWQKDRDLFNLKDKSAQTLALYKIKEEPSNFFNYLLYDFFKIENRQAGASRRYTNLEAYKIMTMRYHLLANNWAFVQGQAVLVARPINASIKAVITEQNSKYRGLVFAPSYRRRYAEDAKYFCHVLGYVGKISAVEYENYKQYSYTVQDEVGKAGVELSCERYLHGEPGVVSLASWVKDEQGDYFLPATSAISPKPGMTVRLTIDTKDQIAAFKALRDNIKVQRLQDPEKGNAGATVALDTKSGAIISMVSVPVYDPRDFGAAGYDDAAALRVKNYLEDNKHKALLNRCIGEIYAPGSTFKTITSIAAIMEGVIKPGEEFYNCKGIDTVGYREWECFNAQGQPHGVQNLATALVNSCNLYFYQLGLDLGIDKLAKWSKILGLGEYSGIDLPGEVKGIRPGRELKFQTRALPEDQEWYPADTCQTAIGQFDNAYTMLQMVRAIAALATGDLLTPHVIKEITDHTGAVQRAEVIDKRKLDLSPTAIEMVRRGMVGLTRESRSYTRLNFEHFPISVAAKTGTAEVGASQELYITNGLFVCYAPADEPAVAISCIVENSDSFGDSASYIARDILAERFQVELTLDVLQWQDPRDVEEVFNTGFYD